jgi:phage-related baseplate assembly protein
MATLDLSQLPAPDVVETLDYETLLAERKATLISLYPAEQQAAVARTLALESEPIVKLLQENAYREVILRQRVNEAARAVMLAYATGADLDQIGANYNVQRLTLTPADNSTVPPTAAVMESNNDFLMRIQQSFEGLSVAGPTGAYEWHARSADGRIADASAISPSPANVTITVLAREGNGSASAELLARVNAALNDEDVRPVADRLHVQSAAIVDYQVSATLYLYDGVVAGPCLADAQDKLAKFLLEQRRLGRSIRRQAYASVLRVAGVEYVELSAPPDDIILDKTQAGHCTGTQVVIGARDD